MFTARRRKSDCASWRSAGMPSGALKINYAAGGRNQRGRIVGLRIVFMRVDGLRLDPTDSYMSSAFPLDSSVPLDAPQIGGNGDLVVGLFGTASDEDLQSLGLLFVKQDAVGGSKPTRPNGAKSAAEPRLPPEGKAFYVGIWHIYESDRFKSTVTLLANGNARDSRYHDKGGTWSYRNDQVKIVWKDGWEDVFGRDGGKVVKHSFAPNDADEQTPVNEGVAARSQNDDDD